jgi:hypothetical protein
MGFARHLAAIRAGMVAGAIIECVKNSPRFTRSLIGWIGRPRGLDADRSGRPIDD